MESAGTHDSREEIERTNTSQLLRMPYEAFIDRLFARLREIGFTDVNPAHAIVFQHLGTETLRITELADRARLTKQYVGRLVAELENLGYLSRVADPTDGRARLIGLSDRGQELTRAAEAVIAEIEQDWSRRIGGDCYDALRQFLIQLSVSLTRE